MNPYKIEGPALISFSGGRTSAFMLKQIIDAHGGTLPDDIYVTFANTGKEMPETLDFVQACSEHWGVKVHWLELEMADERPVYRTKEVTYETASRDGEPFEALIGRRSYLPNPVARFCTAELKIRRMKDFMWKMKGYKHWDNVLGLRYDEPRRVSSSRNASDRERWGNLMPMYDAKHTVKDVLEFWQKANFDLTLPSIDGQTLAGNCDLCFLKGRKTLTKLIKERPDLTTWWIAQENRIGEGTGATFRSDRPPYVELLKEAENPVMDDMFEDDTMSCFCHD
jgi:3'-phosphoadenosine 5'-phosphosulfate sulfotransferase (PAPS reductase)/FAD synthetase